MGGVRRGSNPRGTRGEKKKAKPEFVGTQNEPAPVIQKGKTQGKKVGSVGAG